MCKLAHFGGRLMAKTNSDKNAAIDALDVPTVDMMEVANREARTLILSVRFMQKDKVSKHQIASNVLRRLSLLSHPATGEMTFRVVPRLGIWPDR
ncbi:MAG: hypothetical protein Q8K52_09000 [Thiobacillus sp.]|nr:hypothetical protein [Thiobacillus sp.]